MNSIRLAPEAQVDAVEIWTYIARNNTLAADRLIDQFDSIFQVLCSQPLMGKSVESLGDDLRFIPVGRYLVFYRVSFNKIEIVRLLHGSRNISNVLF